MAELKMDLPTRRAADNAADWISVGPAALRLAAESRRDPVPLFGMSDLLTTTPGWPALTFRPRPNSFRESES